MMLILLAPFAVVAIAAVAASFAVTLTSYRVLPAEVPDHFDGYGWPDAFGPRPMVFAMTVAQLVVVLIWGAILRQWFLSGDPARFAVVSGFAADGLLWSLTWMQRDIVRVATGEAQRIERPFRPLLLVGCGIFLAIVAGLTMK